jgi:hypothetical protein
MENYLTPSRPKSLVQERHCQQNIVKTVKHLICSQIAQSDALAVPGCFDDVLKFRQNSKIELNALNQRQRHDSN